MEETGRAAPDGTARRVRVPWFPVYGELRHLLRIWPGFTKSHVAGLRKRLAELRGTPQNPVDWQDPDSWIPDKLYGDDRKLARAIWTESGKSVNPRHTVGHWILSQKYRLLVDGGNGHLRLTERGRDFIDDEFGEAEAFLDLQEGSIELLTILADSGPAQRGALLDPWAEFLRRHSRFRSPSTVLGTLSSHLRNLLDRRLINRDGLKYTVTETGLQYLERVGPTPPHVGLHAIGNLTRCGAGRGTIVTTSGFAREAKKDAFAQGAAPITLIDLLIKHEIGVRKHDIDVLSVDLEGLADVEDLGGA